MDLLDAIKIWIKEDKELAHFYIEHSDAEDFDADWIICKCTDHILATIKERSVMCMTAPVDANLEKTRVRLPTFYDLPMSHPQFFEMLKFSLLHYHATYL